MSDAAGVDSGRGKRDRYAVPMDTVESREVIRRSRFITVLGRAESRADASRFVGEVRERHPGATHYCWAFNAGPPGATAQVGMSDAGEPRGTAGRPMLHALLHSGLGEVVAVCARYYGGVKLGTGGLVRAYAGGVRNAAQICPRVNRTTRVVVLVNVSYKMAPRVKHALRALEAEIEDQAFGTDVRMRVLVAADRRAELEAAVACATGGQGGVADAGDWSSTHGMTPGGTRADRRTADRSRGRGSPLEER
ncbi:MAG: YigZ family protein [Gemmatimonadota bacterium]|nr:YigZ family protein [Gemmatimonadota bacterium]MYD12347.1 YigZ family protein [Gemmatimonadota bacterium]